MTRPALPELDELERLIDLHQDKLRVDVVGTVPHPKENLPVYVLEMGPTDPGAPVIAYIGGVHGRERIGTQVLLSYMRAMLSRLDWDKALQNIVSRVRIVMMPIVNPGGMWNRTRGSLAGVDIMRNSPVEAEGKVPFLLGGHRYGPHLPWYRGEADAEMEPETKMLLDMVQTRVLPHAFKITLDCHSGFGWTNRIWFPYAYSHKRIPDFAEVYAMRSIFRSAYPYHEHYIIEPQSVSYTTHGDIWDHLYMEAKDYSGTFLPLTLEMGSWMWVWQSPWQLFYRLGLFNPISEKRRRHVLRQHLVLMNFLLHCTDSWQRWTPRRHERASFLEQAEAHWANNDGVYDGDEAGAHEAPEMAKKTPLTPSPKTPSSDSG